MGGGRAAERTGKSGPGGGERTDATSARARLARRDGEEKALAAHSIGCRESEPTPARRTRSDGRLQPYRAVGFTEPPTAPHGVRGRGVRSAVGRWAGAADSHEAKNNRGLEQRAGAVQPTSQPRATSGTHSFAVFFRRAGAGGALSLPTFFIRLAMARLKLRLMFPICLTPRRAGSHSPLPGTRCAGGRAAAGAAGCLAALPALRAAQEEASPLRAQPAVARPTVAVARIRTLEGGPRLIWRFQGVCALRGGRSQPPPIPHRELTSAFPKHHGQGQGLRSVGRTAPGRVHLVAPGGRRGVQPELQGYGNAVSLMGQRRPPMPSSGLTAASPTPRAPRTSGATGSSSSPFSCACS